MQSRPRLKAVDADEAIVNKETSPLAPEENLEVDDSQMEDIKAATLFLSIRLTEAAQDGLTPEETLGLSYILACISDGL